MTNSIKKEFDIVIYGASGYTGRYVIEELSNSAAMYSIKWAVAGRNLEKLEESLNSVQEYLNCDLNIQDIPLIYASADDSTSIYNMCKRAKLILNCVGPYNIYGGEFMVATCIECETHHIDISAEIKYLEEVQAKYFSDARDKGVYIVEACGFGSLPADYGLALLKQEFPGDLNDVEYFVNVKEGPKGRSTHTGTLLSGLFSVKDHFQTKKLDEVQKAAFKKPLPEPTHHKLQKRLLFYSKETQSLCVRYLGPDERVIERSQKLRFEYLHDETTPVQVNGYFQLTFKRILQGVIFGPLFFLMSLFSPLQRLIAKYPKLFTGGVFSAEGPTRDQVLEGSTEFILVGKGWLKGCNKDATPSSKIKLVITGPEAAYPFTAMCMVQAGITVLLEKDKLPLEGGVLTPGVAFEQTSLRQRLEKRGMTFKVERCYQN